MIRLILLAVAVAAAPPLVDYHVKLKPGEVFGYLRNPEYPGAYESDQPIVWKFESDPDSKIQIKCDDFRLAESENCKAVQVEVITKESRQSYCGQYEAFKVISAENKLIFKLKGDGLAQAVFSCYVKSTQAPPAEEVDVQLNQVFHFGTPEEPTPHFDKVWHLTAEKHFQVDLSCDVNLLEMNPCHGDVLTIDIGDGPEEYCGYVKKLLFSKGKRATVRLELDHIGNGRVHCVAQAVKKVMKPGIKQVDGDITDVNKDKEGKEIKDENEKEGKDQENKEQEVKDGDDKETNDQVNKEQEVKDTDQENKEQEVKDTDQENKEQEVKDTKDQDNKEQEVKDTKDEENKEQEVKDTKDEENKEQEVKDTKDEENKEQEVNEVKDAEDKESTDQENKEPEVKEVTDEEVKENLDLTDIKPGVEARNAVEDSSEHGGPPGKRGTTCRCGWANKPKGRIIRGREAAANEFPWMVGLRAHFGNKFARCGGSIVTHRHVITAAHCLIDLQGDRRPVKTENLYVIVGAHNLDMFSPKRSYREYQAEEHFIRPEFPRFLTHDFAIIVVKGHIEFNEFIGPICLSPVSIYEANKLITIMGWGQTESSRGSSKLLKANTKIIDKNWCRIKEWEVCTYAHQSATCSGDSGGPLVSLDKDTNRYFQVSLVSYGHPDCVSSPSVSTDVAYFYPWLLQKIKATYPEETPCIKV
uniref:Venom S1 protease with CUB domain 1 n=1 Tax=Oncocephalus sp. TaxID=2944721 RepID=A0AB38ZEH3_9HEMI